MQAKSVRSTASVRRWGMVCSVLLAALVGCNDARGGYGSGGDGSVDDTGTPPVDTGTPPVDTGTPPDDAGTPGCTDDTQCRAGMEYCADDNRCVPRVCIDTDVRCVDGVREVCNPRGTGYAAMPCGAQQTCIDGACVDRACTPGARRCVGTDPSRIETCNADGVEYVASACPAGQSCSAGACVPYRCTPNSTRCAGPTSVQACDAAGLMFGAATQCPAGQGCNTSTQTCRVFACTPGSAQCASSTSRTVCSPDGQSTSVVPCGTSESCADGMCRPRVCTAGARRCVSGSVGGYEVCSPDGLGYTGAACAPGEVVQRRRVRAAALYARASRAVCLAPTPRRCAAPTASATKPRGHLPVGTSCSPTTGTCGGWVCTPGTATCADANTRRVCNSDGLGYTNTLCTSSQTCAAGVCLTRACTPGAYSCADLTTRRLCNPDGLGFTTSTCPAMQACLGAGTCTAWRCTPGTTGTTCPTSTSQQVCSADGQGFATVACPTGQVCTAGRCAPPCGGAGEPVCASGQCNTGLAACSGVCRNTSTDATACGPMCTRCPVPANGTARCTAGTCEAVCNDRFNPSNGMCVPCGGDGQPACVTGAACNPGGVNMSGTCRVCAGSVAALGLGHEHTCAALAGGPVRCWGRNNYGQLGNGNLTSSLVPVTSWGSPTPPRWFRRLLPCVRPQTVDGAVWCWGYNAYGQLGDGTTTNRSSPTRLSLRHHRQGRPASGRASTTPARWSTEAYAAGATTPTVTTAPPARASGPSACRG
jgi:hypothetical protein